MAKLYKIRMIKPLLVGGGHLMHIGDIHLVDEFTKGILIDGKEAVAVVIEIDGVPVKRESPQEAAQAAQKEEADQTTTLPVKNEPAPLPVANSTYQSRNTQPTKR